jgi:hypothetical protein
MTTDQGFIDYILEARDQFVRAINEQQWDTALRTEAENILIAYDQMRERLSSPEGGGEDDWVLKNHRRLIDEIEAKCKEISQLVKNNNALKDQVEKLELQLLAK